jgi:hypothetical protein
MHRFAWDRVSFLVPDDWDMSSFETTTSKSHVEMDDGGPVRLVAEWTRLSPPINAPRIYGRYAKAVDKLKKKALTSRELPGLPPDWTATHYKMDAGNSIVSAAHLSSTGRMFFSFLLYFYGSKSKPAPASAIDDALRGLTNSLTVHAEPLTPWECYDMAFRLNSDFRLVETAFLSGRKQMTFQWRQRRLYVWLISLADMVLAGREPQVWACEFLNQIEGLRGPRFQVNDDGAIKTKRRAVWPLGHADQLRRFCFRYKVGLQPLPERNQIFMWAYHYRREEDLKKLEGLACGQ